MPGPAQHFLRRLKDELDRPGQLPLYSGQHPGSAERHGHVAVMAAGMHRAFMPRCEGQPCPLL
ncbi:hypothetical protein D3C77_516410 [compost metagenome]